jgi:hypothetical protein
MMTLLRPEQTDERTEQDSDSQRYVIAREGTELASLLRERGWVARVGWRATTEADGSVWYLRFEAGDDRSLD